MKRNLSHLLTAALFASCSGSLLAAAALENSFAPKLNPGAQVMKVIVDPAGNILLAGTFSEVNGVQRNGFARLAPDGSLDLTFDPGTGPDGPVLALVAGGEGEYYLGGRFSAFDGVDRSGLVCLHPDGSLNESFGSGMAFKGAVNAIASSPAGNLLVGGSFSRVAGAPNIYLAAITQAGFPDPTFRSSLSRAMALESGVDCVALQPDGQILAGGNFQTDHGPAQLLRLNPDGTIDASFNGNPGPLLYPKAILVTATGKIFVAGLASPDGQGFVRRLLPNGDSDPAFTAPTFKGMVHDIALLPGGRVAVAAALPDHPGVRALRLEPNGELDLGWMVSADGPILSLAHVGEGRLLVAGAFSEIQGVEQAGIALISQPGEPVFQGTSTTGAGEFRAVLQAVSGVTYAIEASTDLSNWTEFSTNTATNAGLEIIDPAARQSSRRFFRARVLAK